MRKIIVPLTLAAALAACTAHRPEIQQGNIVSRERLAMVKPGMDEQQVRFALGSPLVMDTFHPDRWEYFYSLEQQGELTTTYRVTLQFAAGKLLSVEERGEIPETERAALEMVSREKE